MKLIYVLLPLLLINSSYSKVLVNCHAKLKPEYGKYDDYFSALNNKFVAEAKSLKDYDRCSACREKLISMIKQCYFDNQQITRETDGAFNVSGKNEFQEYIIISNDNAHRFMVDIEVERGYGGRFLFCHHSWEKQMTISLDPTRYE
ncbi:hypothetical protein N9N67_02670 [Bacteriovoracaceae bacterium]|nr:hypothetical protein [Bacteriovoracaceae bacterium]